MSEIKRKNIKISDQIISYLVTEKFNPDHPTIVWLHGWGSEAGVWKEQMRQLAQSGYQSVAIDWPGFGLSERPKQVFNLNDYAEILGNFLEGLGLDNYHLVAHSFGARVFLVANAKESVAPKKVVFIGAAGLRESNVGLRLKSALGTVGGKLRQLPIVGKLISPLATKFRSRDYGQLDGVMAETFKTFIGQDLRGLVSKINVPIKLIWGENDQETPLSDAYEMKQLLPGAQFITYPDSGHYVFLERETEVAREILLFLDKHEHPQEA